MKFFALILIACGYCGANHEIPLDYYWKEFDGEIPYDALPGGSDKAGNTTFVGQGWVEQWGLLPGSLTAGSPEIRTLGGGKIYTTTTNIKILCARNLYRFKWVPTTSAQLSLLTNCRLISGGTEKDNPVYIGRANHLGETVVGKVYTPLAPWKGVWVPHRNSQISHASFELLTWNCDLHDYCEHINAKN